MKKITLIGTASFPGAESKSAKLDIVWDEFLPIVRFKEPSKYKVDGEELLETKEEVTLSKQLDRNKSTFKIWQITTEKRKLKLPFTIEKGNSGSKDDDGFIDLKISEKDEDIKIISKPQIKAQYNTEIEVELEIKGKEKKEFYLDFYARDDSDYEWNVGEYTNVHCGKLKIIKKEACICKDNDWTYLAPLVSESDKVLYGSSLSWTNQPECYHYALQQLRNLGYWVKTERWNKKWDGTKELNDEIFQLYLDSDVAGMKKGPQKEMFKNALIYLKQAMKSKTPVMVGLDYHSGYANDDLITDHFAVITGCGKDSNGKLYFDVTDNAFNYQKYYCNCTNSEIKSADNQIIITQVRKSKKL